MSHAMETHATNTKLTSYLRSLDGARRVLDVQQAIAGRQGAIAGGKVFVAIAWGIGAGFGLRLLQSHPLGSARAVQLYCQLLQLACQQLRPRRPAACAPTERDATA